MEDLKPCPFCGNKDVSVTRSEWLNEACAIIRCLECGAMLMRLAKLKMAAAKAEVVSAWNLRVHYVEKRHGRRTGKRGSG